MNKVANEHKDSELTGTWKLVSYNYAQSDGKIDENVKIKNAVRIYNDIHFTVFYEYENGTSETCITRYDLLGENLKLKILFHTEAGYEGNEFIATTKAAGDKMSHEMEMDGYKIEEHYERII